MKSKSSIKKGWQRLKSHPILYNIVLLALLLVLLVAIAYIALAIGTRHGMKRTVPDFVGLHLDDVRYYASRRGLEIVINDSLYIPSYEGGMVLDQLPKSGVEVKSGRKVYVTINSFHQKRVPLPYVAERSLRQAKNMLEVAGFRIRELVYVEDMATNYVLREYYNDEQILPDTELSIEKGSRITLHVGMAEGEHTTVVPNLIGRNLYDAESRIWEVGLNVGQIQFDDNTPLAERNNAKVYAQSSMPTKSIKLGASISLQLTLSNEKVAAAEEATKNAIEASLREAALRDSLSRVSETEIILGREVTVKDSSNDTDDFFR